MGKFYENPLPNHIEKREDKEELKWLGNDCSFEIFPHLNLDWQKLEEIYKKSDRKPIGDLGSSFSTIPTEGELRGINIIPVDIMHVSNESRYQKIIKDSFQHDDSLNATYNVRPYSKQLPNEIRKTMGTDRTSENYKEDVEEAIKKVMHKYITADIASIPLKDRSLCVCIVSDSVPKHSLYLKTFLEKQLPEVLRITDHSAYIYPMSMYKAILWKGELDYETNKYCWKKVSDLTPEEIKREELCKSMDPEIYEEIYIEKTTLEETDPLYKNPESIKRISDVAEKMGFEFKLEKAHELEWEKRGGVYKHNNYKDHFTRYQQDETKLGVFIRKRN